MNARPSLRQALALASTLVILAAVTGCHKKSSGVNPSSLGPAPAAPRGKAVLSAAAGPGHSSPCSSRSPPPG